MDETLTTRKGWLDDAHATFTAGLGWGSFDATSMLTGFGTWLTLNETDARWVSDIATTFREAGAGTVSDAVIAASLNAAGLGDARPPWQRLSDSLLARSVGPPSWRSST